MPKKRDLLKSEWLESLIVFNSFEVHDDWRKKLRQKNEECWESDLINEI